MWWCHGFRNKIDDLSLLLTLLICKIFWGAILLLNDESDNSLASSFPYPESFCYVEYRQRTEQSNGIVSKEIYTSLEHVCHACKSFLGASGQGEL